MSITFGGLATGLDTESIIEQLMEIEKAPITSLENDRTWLANKLDAYTEFDTSLNSFLSNAQTLTDRDQYSEKTVSQSSSDYLTATTNDDAIPDTSYRVEVVDLAQRQKSYTDGFESLTDSTFGTGNLTITVNDVEHIIEIDETNNSLEGIMGAINDADIGVAATIINDGTDTPYRLNFTGDDVGSAFIVDSSALLTEGVEDGLGTITDSQVAQQAHIIVDNIDIYSSTNEIEEAIPGVTLNLLDAEVDEITYVNIGSNNSAITTNINSFVTGYNEVIAFVTEQSTFGDSDAGLLGGDSGLSAIKRHLQNMLTTFVDTNGTYSSLAQLGLETQSDGQLTLNTETLSEAIANDEDSIINLISGKVGEEETGIAYQFQTYLEQLTDSEDGLLAGRTESITDNTARIDANIESIEARLLKREETLQNKFNAMELLVSKMNATSSYLTTQLEALESMWN